MLIFSPTRAVSVDGIWHMQLAMYHYLYTTGVSILPSGVRINT